MEDFIFGTLATDELRQKAVRLRRAGVTHLSARSPRDPLPGQPITLELTTGPAAAVESTSSSGRAWVYWTTGGEDPSGAMGEASQGNATAMDLVGVAWDTVLWGYVRRYRAVLPGQAAGVVLRYRLSAGPAFPGGGSEIFADGGAYYACYIDDDPTPAWARDAVVYQIFVDRFNPGEGRSWLQPGSPSGFYGGTLRGIIAKLDYISSLGANCLWLTPVFPSPSHHGYDATNLFEIEPRLGTQADLKALLDAAHARGIRVLLDFVPNHISNQHASFQRALSDPDSPESAWFTFYHWPDDYEAFFKVKELPQLNLRHPGARQHLLAAAAYWLNMGVDGFRVDYAVGPTPDFWADFRRVTRAANPDCWTFGEVVEPPDSQIAFHGLLDGCLDFMLLEALRQAVAFRRWDAFKLADFLDRHEAFFPEDFSRPSFLDNHDMNRILWVLQGDKERLKLAALLQFTLSGPPIIYYGTEVGHTQERDVRQGSLGILEESRLPMPWGADQDAALLAFYQQLTALRKELLCLRRGSRRTLSVGENSLVYERSCQEDKALVAVNLASKPCKLSLPGEWSSPRLETRPGVVLRRAAAGLELTLPPESGTVVV